MLFNKDIIIRLIIGLASFLLVAQVLGPLFFAFIKRRLWGVETQKNDIDAMIRRKKELMRAQYGPPSAEDQARVSTSSKEMEALLKEMRWGGGSYAQSIKEALAHFYSCNLSEAKIHSAMSMAQKKNYLSYWNETDGGGAESLVNFLSALVLHLLLIEDLRSHESQLLESVSRTFSLPPKQLSLAFQLKILHVLFPRDDERFFAQPPSLSQCSDASLDKAVVSLLQKEALRWSRSNDPSLFYEELISYLNYADILTPPLEIKHNKDLEGAHAILKTHAGMDQEDIKRSYKKLAMQKHPDKIGQLKLPKILEKKAILQFNQIQKAYDILMNSKK